MALVGAAVAVVALAAGAVMLGFRGHDRTIVSVTASTTSEAPTTSVAPTTVAPTTVAPPVLDPADSKTPTAGGCSQASGSTGNVTIRADFVPSPRCLVIAGHQELSVTNLTGQTIRPRLGSRTATIADGQTYTFPGTVGSHLAPGVHHLVFSAASAADIWVDAVCRGSGAADCSSP
jgi:hypothetical protein